MGLPIGRGTRRQFRCLTLGRGRRILERHPLEVAAIFAVGGSEIRDDGVGCLGGGKKEIQVEIEKKRPYLQVASQGVELVIRCETGVQDRERRKGLPPIWRQRGRNARHILGPWAPISGAALSADEQGCRAPTAGRGALAKHNLATSAWLWSVSMSILRNESSSLGFMRKRVFLSAKRVEKRPSHLQPFSFSKVKRNLGTSVGPGHFLEREKEASMDIVGGWTPVFHPCNGQRQPRRGRVMP